MFTERSVADRRDMAETHKLCMLCLEKWHTAAVCSACILFQFCGVQQHKVSLCWKLTDKFKDVHATKPQANMYCMSTVLNILNKNEENEEDETERADADENVALARLVTTQMEEI